MREACFEVVGSINGMFNKARQVIQNCFLQSPGPRERCVHRGHLPWFLGKETKEEYERH
jgi:hypothetical protein